MKLHNKKVKINSNKILKNTKKTNSLFIDFVKANSSQILTAIQDQKTPYLYTFEEDDTWLFDETDLIEV